MVVPAVLLEPRVNVTSNDLFDKPDILLVSDSFGNGLGNISTIVDLEYQTYEFSNGYG